MGFLIHKCIVLWKWSHVLFLIKDVPGKGEPVDCRPSQLCDLGTRSRMVLFVWGSFAIDLINWPVDLQANMPLVCLDSDFSSWTNASRCVLCAPHSICHTVLEFPLPLDSFCSFWTYMHLSAMYYTFSYLSFAFVVVNLHTIIVPVLIELCSF